MKRARRLGYLIMGIAIVSSSVIALGVLRLLTMRVH